VWVWVRVWAAWSAARFSSARVSAHTALHSPRLASTDPPPQLSGYPWIDAAMRQLREWGWMHHLARHSVACFLTRGASRAESSHAHLHPVCLVPVTRHSLFTHCPVPTPPLNSSLLDSNSKKR
jgi:hypothetical protein